MLELDDPFMMPTVAVMRALKMTKKALIDLGYEVVEFKMSPQEWNTQREIMMGLIANGPGVLSATDLQAGCETINAPIQKSITIGTCSPLKSFIIDICLKYIIPGKRRMYEQLNGLRAQPNAIELERFLKRKTEWVYDFSKKWQDSGI